MPKRSAVQDGDGEGEEQKARVDGDIEREHVWTGGDHAEEEMICQHRDSDAERATESGKQKGFREELADEARTAGAECLADGELASAGGGASEQQIGDVGAGDQQNDAGEGHEHFQWLRELAAELRKTGGDGRERNVRVLQLGEVTLVGVGVAIAEPDLVEEEIDVGGCCGEGDAGLEAAEDVERIHCACRSSCPSWAGRKRSWTWEPTCPAAWPTVVPKNSWGSDTDDIEDGVSEFEFAGEDVGVAGEARFHQA